MSVAMEGGRRSSAPRLLPGVIVAIFAAMKQLLLLSLILFLLAGSAVRAQKTTTHAPLEVIPQNAVMVNLGGLALDYLNVSYYRGFDSNHALGAYVGYLYHLVGDEQIAGYGFGLSYRYYPAGRAISRFYYSPTIGLQLGDVINGQKDRATGVLVSAMIGWQWFPEEIFAVGLGFGVRAILGEGNSDPVISNAFGASPVITLDLGYGWR